MYRRKQHHFLLPKLEIYTLVYTRKKITDFTHVLGTKNKTSATQGLRLTPPVYRRQKHHFLLRTFWGWSTSVHYKKYHCFYPSLRLIPGVQEKTTSIWGKKSMSFIQVRPLSPSIKDKKFHFFYPRLTFILQCTGEKISLLLPKFEGGLCTSVQDEKNHAIYPSLTFILQCTRQKISLLLPKFEVYPPVYRRKKYTCLLPKFDVYPPVYRRKQIMTFTQPPRFISQGTGHQIIPQMYRRKKSCLLPKMWLFAPVNVREQHRVFYPNFREFFTNVYTG